MSQQKGMSFEEFRQRFQTEEACEVYLFQRRWTEGFVCPKCGGTGCYQLRGRREYVCKHCHRQSSVTVGTVLHHTHLPLTIWFWTIYLGACPRSTSNPILMNIASVLAAVILTPCLLKRLALIVAILLG